MIFTACSQSSGIKRIHVGLGEVLDNLKIILEKYPAVASPEVFASVQMLINYVQCELKHIIDASYHCNSRKSFNQEVIFVCILGTARQNTRICVIEGDRLINQLALYFTKR